MSNIIINDLEISKELSRQALQELKGGAFYCVKRLGVHHYLCRNHLKDFLSAQPNTIQPITYVPYKFSTL